MVNQQRSKTNVKPFKLHTSEFPPSCAYTQIADRSKIENWRIPGQLLYYNNTGDIEQLKTAVETKHLSENYESENVAVRTSTLRSEILKKCLKDAKLSRGFASKLLPTTIIENSLPMISFARSAASHEVCLPKAQLSGCK